MLRSLLVVAPILAAPGFSHADDLTPGLVQNRFVTKQHIIAPTGIAVSPQGVVFVSCDINGTTNTRRNVGKVVRCEDTNDDGVADRSHPG